jgi:hypothetical protein
MTRNPGPLRLSAEDAEDLQVIAAATQDAVGQVGDFVYQPRQRRFILEFNRFRWEVEGARGEPWSRVRSGLAFDGVLGVRVRAIPQNDKDITLQLLDITFAPDTDPPGGLVTLKFAGDGDIVLKVECLDATLVDTEASWTTPRRPRHKGLPRGQRP